MNQEFVRYALTGLTLYGAYTAFTCPCEQIISCHKVEFFGALALAGTLAAINVSTDKK